MFKCLKWNYLIESISITRRLVMRRVLCRFHDDHDPSMTIYGMWAHCWVCGAHILTSELELNDYEQRVLPKQEPTNIPKKIEYIESLPVKNIRGLDLHYDNLGFYVVWPTKNYYKCRKWHGKPKYIAPSKVKAPLWVYPGSAKHLVVIEGELNAATIHNIVFGSFKICSPGSAAEFARHIKYFLQYKRITLILDHDAAGIVHGCLVRNLLHQHGKHATLVTVTQDYNDLLQTKGEEAVRKKFEKDMM